MVDAKSHSIVIAPYYCLAHDITNLVISQNRFGGKHIAQYRLDFAIVHEKDRH